MNTIKLSGKVDVQRLVGKINLVPSENAGGPLQAKTVYPSHSEQTIAPDEDYYGLAVVTVKPVPRVPACEVSVKEGIKEVVENVVNLAVGVEITAEKVYTHFLYNGVRLPKIPEDVLKDNPYAWIRTNTTSGQYDLVLSSQKFYMVDEDSMSGTGVNKPYYQIEISTAESAMEWRYVELNSNNFGVTSEKYVLWSNHDIPYGSADATEIYFVGSEPIPVD